MSSPQLHHVSVVVHDLPAAIAFFTALGLTFEGEAPIEGEWVDRLNGIEAGGAWKSRRAAVRRWWRSNRRRRRRTRQACAA